VPKSTDPQPADGAPRGGPEARPEVESPPELRRPAEAALRAVGVADGHLSVELVDAPRIRELNREHRGRDEPTDVLAFPVDEAGPSHGPRELGDVVICPEYTRDLEEAVVHGVLHLTGHDHETDSGEMLGVQQRVLARLRSKPRSGFIAVAGRPNVGKSTLVNTIVGAKVAVVSDKPQTTRRAIRGVRNGEDENGPWQLVLVDLPGVQRPRDPLTERMQRRVERELGECDGVLFVLNGDEEVGAGDRFIASTLASSPVPVIAALNKMDLLQKGEAVAALDAVGRLEQEGIELREIFPVSARTGAGTTSLVQALVALLGEGPLYYPEEVRSDQLPERSVAELVREQALARTREELPHAIEVQVEEIEPDEHVTNVRAVIWVEAESQKGILIGRHGRMVREIGTSARQEIERLLETRVFLDLTVKVRRHWRRDEGLLDRLGIEG
jgi:GTP-binding protein Era